MYWPCGLLSLIYSEITNTRIYIKNDDIKGVFVSMEGAGSEGDAEYHLILLSDPRPSSLSSTGLVHLLRFIFPKTLGERTTTRATSPNSRETIPEKK